MCKQEFRYRNSWMFSTIVLVYVLIATHLCPALNSLRSTDTGRIQRADAAALNTAQSESNDSNHSANTTEIYEWLLRQQEQTGLLGNQENEYFSGLYTNALAAICYLHEGDIARAERIFSLFNGRLDVAKALPGGFPQFWEANTGQPHLDSDRWIGDNAWFLIALNHHYYKTGKHTFAEMKQTIAEWLISLQDVDGGIQSGFNQDGLMYWKSTEGNLDCYAALIDYPAEREKIGRFLRERMWIPSEGRFRMGSTVSESALDCLSLGVAALGKDYSRALLYAQSTFLCEHISDVTGNTVTGFCDFTPRDRIWLEGTGQMVVAYHIAAHEDNMLRFLGELDKAITPSSRFASTVGLPCHTNNPAWATGSTTIFVPSQAWYLFSAWRFNPMNYSYPRLIDFNKDGIVDLKDLYILSQYWLEDEISAGIAPLPVGEGRIDFKDFAVLAEHWLKDFRLIAHWKLDETEGAIAHDSISDNDGIVHGEPLWHPSGGKLDGMLELDGINDYVSISFVLDPASGPFSVFAWVKGGAPEQVIISQTGGAVWLATDPSQGNLVTALKAPGRSGHQLWSQTVITDGDWHHIGLVRNGYRRALYVDGIEAANDTQPRLEGSDGGLYIGAVDNLDAGSFWSGLIDDIRIYNSGLSADEISDHYEDTFGALPEYIGQEKQ